MMPPLPPPAKESGLTKPALADPPTKQDDTQVPGRREASAFLSFLIMRRVASHQHGLVPGLPVDDIHEHTPELVPVHDHLPVSRVPCSNKLQG